MEVNRTYDFICDHCKDSGADKDDYTFEKYCTYTEMQETVKNTKCPNCGGPIRQDLGFAFGKFNGPGFTKRST